MLLCYQIIMSEPLCTLPVNIFIPSRTKGVSGNGFYKGLPLVTGLLSLFVPLKG